MPVLSEDHERESSLWMQEETLQRVVEVEHEEILLSIHARRT